MWNSHQSPIGETCKHKGTELPAGGHTLAGNGPASLPPSRLILYLLAPGPLKSDSRGGYQGPALQPPWSTPQATWPRCSASRSLSSPVTRVAGLLAQSLAVGGARAWAKLGKLATKGARGGAQQLRKRGGFILKAVTAVSCRFSALSSMRHPEPLAPSLWHFLSSRALWRIFPFLISSWGNCPSPAVTCRATLTQGTSSHALRTAACSAFWGKHSGKFLGVRITMLGTCETRVGSAHSDNHPSPYQKYKQTKTKQTM